MGHPGWASSTGNPHRVQIMALPAVRQYFPSRLLQRFRAPGLLPAAPLGAGGSGYTAGPHRASVSLPAHWGSPHPGHGLFKGRVSRCIQSSSLRAGVEQTQQVGPPLPIPVTWCPQGVHTGLTCSPLVTWITSCFSTMTCAQLLPQCQLTSSGTRAEQLRCSLTRNTAWCQAQAAVSLSGHGW